MATPGVAGLSRRQIDRLGERLRESATAEDRALLAEYRETFLNAQLMIMYDMGRLGVGQSDGGRLKRPESVIAKLERDPHIRLSRMQDIAGCRLVAEGKPEQDEIYARLQADLGLYRAYDLRENPHSGYRAVHVVIRRDDRFVEVQVRTRNQREWARLSELATAYDSTVKYGGGDDGIRQALDNLSDVYWACDRTGQTPAPNVTDEVLALVARMQ